MGQYCSVPPTSDCGISKASLKYIVSHEHLPGHICFDKFLLALLGWEQIIGLCSKLVHIDLCFLLGCHGLCFQKATSVYIASLDRILYRCCLQTSLLCLHDGDYLQTMQYGETSMGQYNIVQFPLHLIVKSVRPPLSTQCHMSLSLDISILIRSLSPTWLRSNHWTMFQKCTLTCVSQLGAMTCAFTKLLAYILLVLIAYYTGAAYRLPFYVCMMVIASR